MFKCSKLDHLVTEFKNNTNSHSYIFYTNDFFECQKDVYELVKNIFNTKEIDTIQTDFVIIKKSDKKNILKEDITGIKNLFQNTSYFNKKRVYLIEEAHKLTSVTANMILKFLEEPLEGVVALFITDNLDCVINTVKSRCQIINAFYDTIEEKDLDENVNKLINILFKNNKYKELLLVKKEYINYEREELMNLFKSTIEYLIKKNEYEYVKVLNKGITLLNNNVNIDYVFDYLLLKGSE